MEFDDILNVLLGIGIGIGMVIVYAWYQYQRLKSHIDRMIEEAVTEKSSIELEIEVDKGRYFCYNSKDKQFVCQGATALEIRHAFQSRFPDKTAYLVAGDPATVAKFKAELETNENSSRI
jgi:hypothetical protein